MTDKKTTKPKTRSPITLGRAVRLTLTPEQEKDLRDVSRETGISQADILERLGAVVRPSIVNLEKALHGMNVRQVALEMKLDELEALKAKLAAMNKGGSE